jgi:hypothetical protein
MTTNMLGVFNDHFSEFINDVYTIFPNDPDIVTAKNTISTLRKANPKLLIKIWIKYIVTPYKQEIEDGNIEFFINKDYTQDLEKNDNAEKILEIINRLRNPIKLMSTENQAKTIKYLQNLSKIALLVPL